MDNLVNAVLPSGEWKWYVLTCFDTLVYFDFESGEFRHGEVRGSPRNVSVARSHDGCVIEINGNSILDTSLPLPERIGQLLRCPPSALVGQIRQIEEGSVSGSS
jgi:hypothetical protein